MNTIRLPYRAPVIKIVQPLGEFFAVALPAELLIRVTYSDRFRKTELGFKGHQREENELRLKEIGEYIDTVEAAFPNSIILAANYDRETGELVEDKVEDSEKEVVQKRWKVKMSKDIEGVGELVIPTFDQIVAIVDGQHRLDGFNLANNELRLSMPLLCSLYIDLPDPIQAYLFATINYNQKPVSKSQTYELFAYNLDKKPDAWTPEMTAVFLSRKLNTDYDSVFKDHILVVAQNDEVVQDVSNDQKRKWAVSTATIVEGLLRLFSSKPKRDRSAMFAKEFDKGRSRSLLIGLKDDTVLREYYLQNNDALIYTIVKNYFNAAADLLWKGDNMDSFIRKTIGIQALFDILRPLAAEATRADVKNISKDFFTERLQPCSEINFADNFFQASGTGRLRIRNSLELCMRLKTLAEIKDNHEDYKRICNITNLS